MLSNKPLQLLMGVLLTVLLLPGCTAKPADSPAADSATPSEGHHHTAPHGGTLIEMGEEFAHLELVLDSNTGALTVYVLDGEAEHPLPLEGQALTITLDGKSFPLEPVADPLTGETKEHTSTYTLSTPDLKGRETFEATLSPIKVKGQTFESLSLKYPKGSDEHDDDHGK